MMAVFNENEGHRPRRQRYTRSPAPVTLTPRKLALLETISAYGLATAPQLAKLVGPSDKSARRHLRELYDGGVIDIIAVPRAVLAAKGEPNDARLLYGSAPNIFRVTKAGQKALITAGLVDVPLPIPTYGPRNWAHIAHAIAIRDVRLWLELSARLVPEQALQTWKSGGEAEIDLERLRVPKRVYPDAWFVYRMGEKVLVSMVEVDRGTERGGKRWQEKVAAYSALFQSGRLKSVTGYNQARILVLTPTKRRRDSLTAFLKKQLDPALAARFWLAEETVLTIPGFGATEWRQPGKDPTSPLIEVTGK
jgi:hypothetical protein